MKDVEDVRLPPRPQPTLEEKFFRLAVEKGLTKKQKEAWDLYNFDKSTFDEIAKALKISRRSARDRIEGAEYSIKMWCEANMHIYDLIKSQQQEEDSL
jgi:predicted DNA-binding protein YlxM (UPF0122 family)